MRLLRSAVLVIAATVSGHAMSEVVKQDMPACLTEELLDELTTYSAKKDKAGFIQLFKSGQCIGLRTGTVVSVISPGFMTAAIRYKGVKLYTPSEAIR